MDLYDDTGLNIYLNMDTWEDGFGLCVLAGIDPRLSTIRCNMSSGYGGGVDEYPLHKVVSRARGDFINLYDKINEKRAAYTIKLFSSVEPKKRLTPAMQAAMEKYNNLLLLWNARCEDVDFYGNYKPCYMIDWAKSKAIEIEWLDWAVKQGVYETQGSDNHKEPSSIELASLQKMVLSMAISKYDYDPGSKKNYCTGSNNGSIKSDIENIGLNLESDTIRSHLKKAAELFYEK